LTDFTEVIEGISVVVLKTPADAAKSSLKFIQFVISLIQSVFLLVASFCCCLGPFFICNSFHLFQLLTSLQMLQINSGDRRTAKLKALAMPCRFISVFVVCVLQKRRRCGALKLCSFEFAILNQLQLCFDRFATRPYRCGELTFGNGPSFRES
jgi:hypothetical protein